MYVYELAFYRQETWDTCQATGRHMDLLMGQREHPERPLLASLGVGEGPCAPQNARRDEHTGTGPRAWDWTMTTWSLSVQREDSWIGHKDTYVPVTATLMEQLAVCFISICSIDAETDSFRTRQRSDAFPSHKTHKCALSPH